MQKRWIIGNWKMNGSRQQVAEWLTQWRTGISQNIIQQNVTYVLCPPAIYLAECTSAERAHLKLGGQNLSLFQQGAYTGEISAAMLKDYQCEYVLVGHSERRQLFGETDTDVAEKILAAQSQGLRAVLCVGETLQQREQKQTEKCIAEQLSAVLQVIGAAAIDQLLIAYEPVWAIGSGLSATPEQAQKIHANIRGWFQRAQLNAPPILYGGSVSPDNAAALLSQPDIAGLLVGGASLNAAAFLRICEMAHHSQVDI